MRAERGFARGVKNSGIARDELEKISASLIEPPRQRKHLEMDSWMGLYMSQPWLAQQQAEYAKQQGRAAMEAKRSAAITAVEAELTRLALEGARRRHSLRRWLCALVLLQSGDGRAGGRGTQEREQRAQARR